MMRWGGNGPAPEFPRNAAMVIGLGIIAAGLFLVVITLLYVLVTR